MSLRPSRTVTGVFTRATRTLTLACVSLGGCWTSAPGLGAIGPEGACARAGAWARARRSVRVRDAPAILSIRITWYHKTESPPSAMQHLQELKLLHYTVLDSTHVQRKTLPREAAIPTIKVRLNGREDPCPMAKSPSPSTHRKRRMKIPNFWRARRRARRSEEHTS